MARPKGMGVKEHARVMKQLLVDIAAELRHYNVRFSYGTLAQCAGQSYGYIKKFLWKHEDVKEKLGLAHGNTGAVIEEAPKKKKPKQPQTDKLLDMLRQAHPDRT